MLTILIKLLILIVASGLATVLIVFVSALCVGVAETTYTRAKAVSSAITGKSADQHHNVPGDQV